VYIKLKDISIRLVKFGIVGVVCTVLQIVILRLLTPNIPAILASAIGFLISAQLNFFLSYFITWRDSKRKRGKQFRLTWLRFNSVVLVGVVVNTIAFALIHLVVFDELAVIFATVFSTSCTFLLNHFYVLTPERKSETHEQRDSSIPTVVE
jgi:putative flippase GtrA